MKAKISNKKLLEAVKKLEKFTEKKDMSSITAHYLLEASAEQSTLTITASNYEMGLTQIIRNVAVEESGFATAQAKTIGEILAKTKKDEDIVFEEAGTNLVAKVGNTKFNLPMFCYQDYPEYPKGNEKVLNIDTNVFLAKLKLVKHAMDKDNNKSSLNGIFVGVREEQIAFAATETHTLAYAYVDAKNEEVYDFVVPREAVMQILSLFDCSVKITICNDEESAGMLYGYGDDFVFFTKLINDKFPDFEKVIPEKINEEVKLSKQETLDVLDKLSIASDKFALNLRLDGKMIYRSCNFVGSTSVVAEFDKALPLNDNFLLVSRIKYVQEFLKNVSESEFTLKLSEENTAFLFVSKEFSEVIMSSIIHLEQPQIDEYGLSRRTPPKPEEQAETEAETTEKVDTAADTANGVA